jgi:hypothetical protein
MESEDQYDIVEIEIRWSGNRRPTIWGPRIPYHIRSSSKNSKTLHCVDGKDLIDSKVVIVKDKVITIPDYFFKDLTCVEYIRFKDGNALTELGIESFAGCGLKELDLLYKPCRLIKEKAFMGCVNLDMIYLPFLLTEIGKEAFMGCTKLSNIDLLFGVTKIDEGAFMNCTSLNTIEFPASLREIGSKAFANCKNLKILDFSQTTNISIDITAFDDCIIEKVVLPLDVAQTSVVDINLLFSYYYDETGKNYTNGEPFFEISSGLTIKTEELKVETVYNTAEQFIEHHFDFYRGPDITGVDKDKVKSFIRNYKEKYKEYPELIRDENIRNVLGLRKEDMITYDKLIEQDKEKEKAQEKKSTEIELMSKLNHPYYKDGKFWQK